MIPARHVADVCVSWIDGFGCLGMTSIATVIVPVQRPRPPGS